MILTPHRRVHLAEFADLAVSKLTVTRVTPSKADALCHSLFPGSHTSSAMFDAFVDCDDLCIMNSMLVKSSWRNHLYFWNDFGKV